jgi:hypothetical protein
MVMRGSVGMWSIVGATVKGVLLERAVVCAVVWGVVWGQPDWRRR